MTFDLCPAHLVFLRELQVVVGLEELCVLGQLGDGDGGVVHHTCSSRQTPRKDPPGGGEGGESVSKADKELRNSDICCSCSDGTELSVGKLQKKTVNSHKEKQSKSEGTRPELKDFCSTSAGQRLIWRQTSQHIWSYGFARC